MKFALTKDDSTDLGLPIAAVGKAITWDELQEWINFIVESSTIDDLPAYVFDLMDPKANGGVLKMQRQGGSIGFMLATGLDEPRYESLWGIGYARKDSSIPKTQTGVEQNIVSREDAKLALSQHPEILEWFTRFFEAIGKPDELS